MRFPQERRELLEPVPLRELLIEATLTTPIGLQREVKRIDLGVFGQKAEGLLQRTLDDPEKRERGTIVYVTQNRDVFIQTEEIVASSERANYLDMPISANCIVA